MSYAEENNLINQWEGLDFFDVRLNVGRWREQLH